MITFAAHKNKRVGLGHFSRSKKYYNYLLKKKQKVNLIKFKSLKELFDKIKKIKSDIIFLDSYIFSKKISLILKKNFKKIIICNDYQFKIPKNIHVFDSFKYPLKKNMSNYYFGTNFCIINKKFLKKKIIKKNILIILNKKNQNLFYKIYDFLDKSKKFRDKEKYVINISNRNIFKFLKKKEKWNSESFLDQEKILNFASLSQIIICPGGQTMMNLIECNFFPNVYMTSSDQNYYIKKLSIKNKINMININRIKLKHNRKNNYINHNFDLNLNEKKINSLFRINE